MFWYRLESKNDENAYTQFLKLNQTKIINAHARKYVIDH